MRKSGFLLVLLSFLSAIMVFIPEIDPVKASDVTGIINSDTTWTKENSPYALTGPMLVSNGATLIIEPGVTMNLNDYYIRVNGTLYAKGSNLDPIRINDGSTYPPDYAITFTEFSSNWTEQTVTGSLIENVVLSSTTINIERVSPKISNNVLEGSEITITDGGSPVITHNTLTNGRISSIPSSSISPGATEGSPIISHNTLTNGGITVTRGYISSGFPIISNNSINGGETGISCCGYAYISDNTVYGCQSGIQLYSEPVFGGSFPSYPIVERNLITHNDRGISILLSSRFDVGILTPKILNNTISDNYVGIYIRQSNYEASPTITYNNLYNNSNYNIQLTEDTENDVNATYNWWGTTDAQAINQSIFDFKYDFSLGTVIFVPFLTEPNPEELSTPIPEFPSWIILPVFLIATLLASIFKKKYFIKSLENQKPVLFNPTNYVVSELGFYYSRDLSFVEVEGGFFEFLHHLSSTKCSEVSPTFFGGTK